MYIAAFRHVKKWQNRDRTLRGQLQHPSLKSLVGPLKCEIGHVSYMDKSAHDCPSIKYVLFVILRRFKGFQIDWYSLTCSTFKTFLGPFIMISNYVFTDIQIDMGHSIDTQIYLYIYHTNIYILIYTYTYMRANLRNRLIMRTCAGTGENLAH